MPDATVVWLEKEGGRGENGIYRASSTRPKNITISLYHVTNIQLICVDMLYLSKLILILPVK